MFTLVCVLQSAANTTRAETFPPFPVDTERHAAQESPTLTHPGDMGMAEFLSNLEAEASSSSRLRCVLGHWLVQKCFTQKSGCV